MGGGIFSLGLVADQSCREGDEWGIWKAGTGSIDCLLRTIRREWKDGYIVAVRGTWVGPKKGIPFCLILIFCFHFFFKILFVRERAYAQAGER